MSFLKNLFETHSSHSGSDIKYFQWMQELEKLVSHIYSLLAASDKADRFPQFEDSHRRINVSIYDLSLLIAAEQFTNDTRSNYHIHHTRVILLQLWSKLLLSLEKIEDIRTLVLWLDTIAKIMVRTEFDMSHLCLNETNGLPTCRPEIMVAFKQYRQLLVNMHVYVSMKLAGQSPASVDDMAVVSLDLIYVYAKIMSINYFRLPEVGGMVSESVIHDPVSYRLTDFEERRENLHQIQLEVPPQLTPTSSTTSSPNNSPLSNTDNDNNNNLKPEITPFSQSIILEPEQPNTTEVPWVTKQQLAQETTQDLIPSLIPVQDNNENINNITIEENTLSLIIPTRDINENSNNNITTDENHRSASTLVTLIESMDEIEDDSCPDSGPNSSRIDKFLGNDLTDLSFIPELPITPGSNEFLDDVITLLENYVHKTEMSLQILNYMNLFPIGTSDAELIPRIQLKFQKTPKTNTFKRIDTGRHNKWKRKSIGDNPQPLSYSLNSPSPPSYLSNSNPGSGVTKKLSQSSSPATHNSAPLRYGKSSYNKNKKEGYTFSPTKISKRVVDNRSKRAARDISVVSHNNSTEENLVKYELRDGLVDFVTMNEQEVRLQRIYLWDKLESALSILPNDPPLYNIAHKDFNTTQTEYKSWTLWFSSKSILFIIFIKEWIEHIRRMVSIPYLITIPSKPHLCKIVPKKGYINWRLIEGFTALLDAYLHLIKNTLSIPKLVLLTGGTLLYCEPVLINYYLRHIFSRTPTYNFPSVIGSLGKLQAWFQEFKESHQSLPSRFDISYFCRILDGLFDTDHHQILNRLLQLLYEFSDIFLGPIRNQLISEFLIQKHFFYLFLHWDDVTRNYFQQFLIFKAVRVKRSQFNKRGLNVNTTLIQSNNLLGGELNPESELFVDAVISNKIQTHVQMVEDQLRDPVSNRMFDSTLEVYIPRSLAEYRTFMARHETWDNLKGEWKLVPLMLLQKKLDTIPNILDY